MGKETSAFGCDVLIGMTMARSTTEKGAKVTVIGIIIFMENGSCKNRIAIGRLMATRRIMKQ